MKFRKINETTINCIITQDDLKKHGINLDDLFDRKKNAVECGRIYQGRHLKSGQFRQSEHEERLYVHENIGSSGPFRKPDHLAGSGCIGKNQGDDRKSGSAAEGDGCRKQDGGGTWKRNNGEKSDGIEVRHLCISVSFDPCHGFLQSYAGGRAGNQKFRLLCREHGILLFDPGKDQSGIAGL